MKRFRTAIIACFTGCLAIVLAVPAWSATSVTCSSPASARPEPTEYFVSLADPGRHLAHISIRLRDGSGVRTLDMPVWNAIYQVRDFAANIENVQAQGASGAEATVRKTKTSEWEITAPTGCVVVSYDIHVDVPGPFGSALDADHGFFNWAMVLMYSPSLRSQSMSIRLLDTPTTWEMRDLHVLGAAVPGTVDLAVGIAHNYDELVDSPVAVGTFQQSSFQQDGATYHIVVDGNPADYDMEQLDKTLAAITHAAVDWMQDRPYGEYTFLYWLHHAIGQATAKGQFYGMQTFNQSLVKLFKDGLVKEADVMDAATSPDDLKLALRGIEQRSGRADARRPCKTPRRIVTCSPRDISGSQGPSGWGSPP